MKDLSLTHSIMKYYTQSRHGVAQNPFAFKIWMDYKEAVTNAQSLLKMCDVPHIDIVEHTTNKTFITLHKLDVIPKQTDHISQK